MKWLSKRAYKAAAFSSAIYVYPAGESLCMAIREPQAGYIVLLLFRRHLHLVSQLERERERERFLPEAGYEREGTDWLALEC